VHRNLEATNPSKDRIIWIVDAEKTVA